MGHAVCKFQCCLLLTVVNIFYGHLILQSAMRRLMKRLNVIFCSLTERSSPWFIGQQNLQGLAEVFHRKFIFELPHHFGRQLCHSAMRIHNGGQTSSQTI